MNDHDAVPPVPAPNYERLIHAIMTEFGMTWNEAIAAIEGHFPNDIPPHVKGN